MCEWCADFYIADYYLHSYRIDPLGPQRSGRRIRVSRGGWYRSPAAAARSSKRYQCLENQWPDESGFRVACTIPYPPEGKSAASAASSSETPTGQPTDQPAAAVITPEDGWVELLPVIDPEADGISGEWKRLPGGTVQGSPTGEEHAVLRCPVEPYGEYQVRVQFIPKVPIPAWFTFPVPPRRAATAADASDDDGSGEPETSKIQDEGLPAAAIQVETGRSDEDGTPLVVEGTVRLPAEEVVDLNVTMDGKPLRQLKAARSLIASKEGDTPNPALLIGCRGNNITKGDCYFYSVQVKMLSGHARLLRAPSGGELEADWSLPPVVGPGLDLGTRLDEDGEFAYVETPVLLSPQQAQCWEAFVTVRSVPHHRTNRCVMCLDDCLTLTQVGSQWLFDRSWTRHDSRSRAQSHDDCVRPGRPMHLAAISTGEIETTAGRVRKLRLFVDGRLVAQSDRTPSGTEPTPIYLGGAGGEVSPSHNPQPFDGVVHAVRISRGQRYLTDFTPPETFEADTDTIALYRCDEGQGDVLHDSSGNEHHATIVGAKWWPPAEPSPVGDDSPEETDTAQEAPAQRQVSAETTPPAAASGDAQQADPPSQAEQDEQTGETQESAEPESVEGVRTWMDAKGNTVEAVLVKFEDGVVHLRLADGKIAEVPLGRLSKQDQEHVAQRVAKLTK